MNIYTSYVILSGAKRTGLDSPYVVHLHQCCILAKAQPLFSFTHPSPHVAQVTPLPDFPSYMSPLTKSTPHVTQVTWPPLCLSIISPLSLTRLLLFCGWPPSLSYIPRTNLNLLTHLFPLHCTYQPSLHELQGGQGPGQGLGQRHSDTGLDHNARQAVATFQVAPSVTAGSNKRCLLCIIIGFVTHRNSP